MTLEAFSRLVPDWLLDRSGEVFYSGRAAFSGSREVYLLGYNPGSDPNVERKPGDELNTVRSSIDKALSRSAERFSLYYQEWETGRPQTMQKGIRRFFAMSGLDPCLTPSSNCVFVRSPDIASMPKAAREELEDDCWPFHQAVIEQLRIKAVLCMGDDAYKAVADHFRVTGQVDEEPDGWRPPRWHRAYATESGMILFKLLHPSRGHWQKDEHNPAALVRRVLGLRHEGRGEEVDFASGADRTGEPARPSDRHPEQARQHTSGRGSAMAFCAHNRDTDGYAESRSKLESRLENLPANTGGASRDGCVYCAYERGWKDAEESITRRFQAIIESLSVGRVE